jgi:phage-related protein
MKRSFVAMHRKDAEGAKLKKCNYSGYPVQGSGFSVESIASNQRPQPLDNGASLRRKL